MLPNVCGIRYACGIARLQFVLLLEYLVASSCLTLLLGTIDEVSESGPAHGHGHGQLQAVLHWMRVQAKYYVMLMSSLPLLGSICVGFGLVLLLPRKTALVFFLPGKSFVRMELGYLRPC